MINDIKLFKQTFQEADKYAMALNPNPNQKKVTLVGLVSGGASGKGNSNEDLTTQDRATNNLIEHAKKMQATHVFGVTYQLHSNKYAEFVIASGDAYRIE